MTSSKPQFMPRVIPRDYRFEKLFVNFTDYMYFQQGEFFPFQAQDPQLINFWWLAEFSLLIYAEAEYIDYRLQSLAIEKVIRQEAAGLRVLVLVFSTHVVVVFRGTTIDCRANILTDLKCLPVAYGRHGYVHQGFLQGLHSLWKPLYQSLWPFLDGRPVWFTGHSLGGALATLAFERLQQNAFLVSFGAPRVGNQRFCKRVARPAFRVVNNNDIVPHLPPGGGYQHCGELIYLDCDGQILQRPDLWRQVKSAMAGHHQHLVKWWEAQNQGLSLQIPWDSLVDHSPFHYGLHLWNAMVRTA